MASSASNSQQLQQQQQQQQQQHIRQQFRDSNNADGAGSHQHAIHRIASAHGPRDSVQHLQHNASANNSSVGALNQKMLPPYSNNINNQQQTQQLVRSTLISEISLAPAPPPLYQQAVIANTGSNINNSGDFGKFSSTRKSPESRAVQAVPPFGVREIANSIPDECQIVKQLVRDVVSGQLNSTASPATMSSVSAITSSPSIPPTSLPVEPYMPPPAYNVHHQRLQQSNSHKMQQQPIGATTAESVQGQQSAAHPLLNVNAQPVVSNFHNGQAFPLSPKDNVAPRMSLSHPDLTRIQNLPPYNANNNNNPSNSQQHQQQTTTKMHPLLAAQQSQLTQPNLEASVYEVSNVPLPSDVLPPSNVQRYAHMLNTPPLPSARYYEASAAADHPSYSAFGGTAMHHHGSFASSSGAGVMSYMTDQRMDVQNVDIERRATARMLEQLAQDNKNLRNELETYIKKTYKLQQLELQYQKIQREYEELVRKADKREHLQEQMQKRVQQELARLTEINSQLTEQLDAAVGQITQYHIAEAEDGELRQEITRRERMLTEFLAQNKALLARNESQAKELQEQEATLEAQRTHISILDKALGNAQEKNLKLEEELKKKVGIAQRCEKLEQLVAKLKDAGQKREDTHKRNIAHLQKELTQLQIAKKTERERSGNSSDIDETKLSKLKREIQEKDEQVFTVQQEALQWQNMYYDEIKRRETAVEETCDSKEAKIKDLEDHCAKTEKQKEVALSETKKYSEELRSCRAQNNELETQKEMYEMKVAELKAMNNVLKRRLEKVGGNLQSMESSFESRTPKSSPLFSLSESYSGSSSASEDAKKLLLFEANRRRCLYLSPSPSRYAAKLYQKHNKFTSMDASFNLDTSKSLSDYGSLGRSTARRQSSTSAIISPSIGSSAGGANSMDDNPMQHGRTQSSCESSFLSSLNSSGVFGVHSASSPLSERGIFTLPTRRSRTKIPSMEQGKLNRPRSADDHLLSTEDNDVFKLSSHEDDESTPKPENQNSEEIVKKKEGGGDGSAEQLWDV